MAAFSQLAKIESKGGLQCRTEFFLRKMKKMHSSHRNG
jgi:hypothetical protein